MRYYSLNRKADRVDFREACIRGLAPDRGLYFPESIPLYRTEIKEEIEHLPNEEIAFSAIQPFVGNVIDAQKLKNIVTDTLSFPMPLVKLSSEICSLELFHGPTLAFKDVGARFMSRCLGYFAAQGSKKAIVLVATSGDTGGAVADGFFNVDGVEVVILYPSGKVSAVQEKQFTTLGRNIHALEIKGNFDDCQHIVKHIFNNARVNERLFLTSANSINVARWLPQQFYYLFAWKQLGKREHPVISVPCGNFGNLCAAMLANVSGMPVNKFIAACNSNDTIPRYLESGKYAPQKTIATISNAMDVSDPSNFIRIEELYRRNPEGLKRILYSVKVTEEETEFALRQALADYAYQLDPHGAVAFYALKQYLQDHIGEHGYFVETAHPVKFYNSVEAITGTQVNIPEQVIPILEKEKKGLLLDADHNLVEDYLYSL